MEALFKHQRVILDMLRIYPRFAVFADPGTGKTLPVLNRLVELLKAGRVQTALIVSPKSAEGAWTRDEEMFDPEDQALIDEHVEIVSYDKVWRGKTYERQFDLIILDESHYIKNRNSRRGKFLLRRCAEASYVYELTGTPVSNGAVEDLFSQITALEPYIDRGNVYSRIFQREWNERDGIDNYRGSYSEFVNRYCILDQFWKPCRYIRMDELQEIVRTYSIRFTKAECLDLPDQRDEIVEVEQSEKAMYKRLVKESALVEYDLIAENSLARMTKLRQLCSGHISTDDGLIEIKCGKPAILSEIIDSFPETSKLAIFAEFKYSIRTIEKVLDGMSIRYVTLDGDQKDKNIWRKFQSDPKIRVIICQYQSGGTGIDLFAASTEIFYEPTLRSTILEQARDRIHRVGQTEPCTYIHMLTKGTIEENIYKALIRYQDFSTRFFEEYIQTYQRNFRR